jgi:hypothetical protein
MKQSKLVLCALLFISSLLGSLIGSSAANAVGPTATPRKQNRTAYRAELEALMTEHKVACKFSMDCEAHPLGAKACGGPTEYLIMSKGTRMKMQDALTDLTKTINEMDTTANAGQMGTCEAMVKPELVCSAGTCVKKAGHSFLRAAKFQFEAGPTQDLP